MSSDISAPRSPFSDHTPEQELIDFHSHGLNLDLAPFGLEHIYDYEPGGHHPVLLGDFLGSNGRYGVIHKLGNGGFANVWLCRDTKAKEAYKYVALKILMAEASTDECPELRSTQLSAAREQDAAEDDGANFICLPLPHFKIHGPNGDHLCFLYPVLGPNISRGSFQSSGDADKDLRNMSLQLLKAVQFVHIQGICHGEVTASNILHDITGLDGLNEDEVLKILGSPILNPVLNDSQERHRLSTAPDYLVYPVNWSKVNTEYITKDVRLIDFGESFAISEPPGSLGTPGPYRSPELILEKKAGIGSDIWALACTIFEARTGRKLFAPFDDDDVDYLIAFMELLGILPEPWWSTTWQERKRWYKDKADEQGYPIPIPVPRQEKEKDYTVTVHPSVGEGARSLKAKIAVGLWYMDSPEKDGHRDISEKEQELLADLLGQMLHWRSEERILAKEAMEHEWFRL